LRELYATRPLWRAPIQLDNSKLVRFLGKEPHKPLQTAVDTTLRALNCLGQLWGLIAYRDPVPGKRPQFLDEPVVQLIGPLPREESNDFVSSVNELRSFLQRESIAYARATPGIASIPSIFGEAHLCIALSRVNGGKGGGRASFLFP
jgi:hypothetical protein